MSHRRRTTASLCAIASTVSLTAVFLPAAAAQDLPGPGSSDVASSIESSLPGSHVPDLTGTDGPKNIIYLVGDGKSAGVVSSVPFNHATPAAWAAHNDDRNDFHAMADEMIGGDLDVIMGAGHPLYDEDNQPVDEPNYEWSSEKSFTELSAGETDFTYLEEDADFQTLADGDVEAGEKYFGLPQVASTLQHNRSGDSAVPYDTELNDVVDLSTMAEGALNILDQNDEGFHVMIEGGAIDWAGEMPEHSWHSDNHTNQLVPVFFRGAGSKDITAAATGVDPVRGNYIDNVDIANLTLNTWWGN